MPELALCLKERCLAHHALAAEPLKIGRDPSNEVVIDNVGVSRHHATVFYHDGSYRVRDEGSQNGVFVNGTRVLVRELHEGDKIQLGKFSLIFSLEQSVGSEPIARRSPRTAARDPMQTMALDQSEVEKLLSGRRPSAAPTAELTEPDGTGRVLGFGMVGILIVSVIAYIILIR